MEAFKNRSDEWKKNISKANKEKRHHKGSKNGMYKKSCFEIWKKKYGIEEEQKRQIEANKKNSNNNKLEKNAMWKKKRNDLALYNIEIKSHPVFQYDFDGNFIKEWRSMNYASKSLNISMGTIKRCCNGSKTKGEFVWIYKK